MDSTFEDDFLDYLRGLSFKERRAFDMAMGYVFGKVSDLNLHLPKSGLYVFLKASDAPLGPFYNEHRDRRALCFRTRQTGLAQTQILHLPGSQTAQTRRLTMVGMNQTCCRRLRVGWAAWPRKLPRRAAFLKYVWT